MKTHEIITPPLLFVQDLLVGDEVRKSVRTIGDLPDIFQDKESFASAGHETIAYEVSSYIPTDNPSPGALNFGLTRIYPGKIGCEYYMTKGHFHTCTASTEYYWGIEGEGILILMGRDRRVWGERMFPGSLHYIGPDIAHRVANTGHTPLLFGACWPSDAGHDYEEIAVNGFSARLLEKDGTPQLVSL